MTLPDDERRLEAAAKALLAASWPGSLSYDKRDPEDQRHCREAMAKAIAAYENEPEPVPQLFEAMARAICQAEGFISWQHAYGDEKQKHLDAARAALGVVVRKLTDKRASVSELCVFFDISESMVRRMLDEQ